MGDKTGISWTDATWNPIVGCSIVSRGCKNCYAMKVAGRMESISQAHEAAHGGDPGPLAHYRDTTKIVNRHIVWTGKMSLAPPTTLVRPIAWKRPRRIFVNSMSDLFHENVPQEWIDRVFAVMAMSPQHQFQVLTKRPERMRDYCKTLGHKNPGSTGERIERAAESLGFDDGVWEYSLGRDGWVLPNVWMGVSAEDQETADERLPILAEVNAVVRFISAEPLLGPIDLGDHLEYWKPEWLIVGGESGADARPFHLEWARSLAKQCLENRIPFFMKQLGSQACAGGVRYKYSGKGDNPEEWPDSLRVQEWPQVA